MSLFKLLLINFLGGSLTGSGGSYGGKTGLQGSVGTCQKQLMSQESFDNLIYPFLTMKSFPPEFIVHIGKNNMSILERSF